MLEGQWFAATETVWEHNFAFNEAISSLVDCDTQEEIDYTGKGSQQFRRLSSAVGSKTSLASPGRFHQQH